MIEFFFDCSSPWTWLAFHQIQPLAMQEQATIRWRPILVGGVFNSVNPSVYAARDNPVPAKAAYQRKDLADWARSTGLVIRMPPSVFPVNSVKAMRGCVWLQGQLQGQGDGALVRFASAVFEAYWSHDRDISQDEVLTDICRGCGIDGAAFMAAIATPEIKARLKANTDELIARGGFGSPTMFVNGDDMYFGNDRLPLLREALRRGPVQ
jgi:2-hydroxychromene-2-carboxylate isomerase